MRHLTPEAQTVETEFALRSAQYMARHGLRPAEICDALRSELDLTEAAASKVVDLIAA